jgi:hypothetical protein
MSILELLKAVSDKTEYCAICGGGTDWHYWHKPACHLKAAIDALESGSLVVVDAQTARLGQWGKNVLPVETPFKGKRLV